MLGCLVLGVFLGHGGDPAAQTDPAPAIFSPSTLPDGGCQLSYQDYANLIAGRPVASDLLSNCVNLAGWRQYATDMDKIWGRFEKKSLLPMRSWAAQELGAWENVGSTVFYPFSGPDAVNTLAFFPRAKNYILVALEPVGNLPSLKPGENEPFFGSLEVALSELLQFNFFFTKRMENTLVKKDLSGVFPLLLFFLGREQVQILEIYDARLQADGTIVEQPAQAGLKMTGSGLPGVRIVFQRPPDSTEQTLYYFQFNLANDSWRRHPSFAQFIKDLGPFQTFIKAASYLMFKPHFGDIRQFILDHSQMILQTDEGIPVKYFDAEKWERRFYGRYSCPIQLFSNCFQADLAAIYQNGQHIQPLPFGIGYHHRRHSANLMVATRKIAVAREGAP